MVVRIAGQRLDLWRAIDDEGEVHDMLVQRRRETRSALRLMRKLLRKQGFVPKCACRGRKWQPSASEAREQPSQVGDGRGAPTTVPLLLIPKAIQNPPGMAGRSYCHLSTERRAR
jgi:hypothetical protein